MKRTSALALVAVTAGFFLYLSGTALGDPGKPNTMIGAALGQARVSPAAENVRLLSVAYYLVDFGRKSRAPEALIAAASLISSIETSEWSPKPRSQKNATAASAGVPSRERASRCEPDALIQEARTMDPTLQGMGHRVGHKMSVRRNSIGGPKYATGTAPASTTEVYELSFRGGEWARVAAKGDEASDLDLYVYDEDGNLVASDTGPSDACLVEWVPARTGKFLIHVVNTGSVDSNYEIVTN